MFRVGQRVVCIDTKNLSGGDSLTMPRRGTIYTVRESFCSDTFNGLPCIRLAEILNPIAICFESREVIEPYFRASRFRPVVSRPTSIAIFQRLLAPSREKETAL